MKLKDNFFHDKDKMVDFKVLTKEEFLKSYSYLTEEEYNATEIKLKLEYLRGEIEREYISTSEILELQSLSEYIEPDDTLLQEWALVPEFKAEEQLVIFEYCDEDRTETEWLWTTKTEREAIKQECYDWIAEANDFTDDEAREFYTVSNFWIVEDAVKKV